MDSATREKLMAEIWARLAQQIGGGSRTDVLRALVWPSGFLLIALVTASIKKAPDWIQVLLAVLMVGFMLLYAASYIFFGLKDPNLLRSEKYNIEKLAIERGVTGDSNAGITDESTKKPASTKTITAEKSK